MNYRLSYGIFLIVLLAGCARPVAQFNWSGETKAPAALTFANNSQHAETYLWDFGDGQQSTEATPAHAFQGAGNYLVSLTAQKGNKKDVSYQRIMVEGPERCLVEIETDFGNMLVWLFDATPQHRDNFMKLVEEGFYDELLFHRVIRGFMIQGGDPQSRNASARTRLGSGGPGYTVPAELQDSLIHMKGALAAARTGDNVNPQRRSSGSQFYIVQGRQPSEAMLKNMSAQNGIRYTPEQVATYLELGGTPQLDGAYTVYGRVIKGLEVIDEIAAQPTNRGDRPQKDVKMKMKVVDYFPEGL